MCRQRKAERGRVEKHVAMTTWGEGEENPRRAREKLRVREVRERDKRSQRGIRERGGAEQPFL